MTVRLNSGDIDHFDGGDMIILWTSATVVIRWFCLVSSRFLRSTNFGHVSQICARDYIGTW
jgi:hypothetical protein